MTGYGGKTRRMHNPESMQNTPRYRNTRTKLLSVMSNRYPLSEGPRAPEKKP